MKHKIKYECPTCNRLSWIPLELELEFKPVQNKEMSHIISVKEGMFNFFYLRVYKNTIEKINNKLRNDRKYDYNEVTKEIISALIKNINDLHIPFQDLIFCLLEMSLHNDIYVPAQAFHSIKSTVKSFKEKEYLDNIFKDV